MTIQHGAVADILGIGFGPANIALAIALAESKAPFSIQFLERRDVPGWHPDMLLDGADIQNNPLRDFVTPRNPRSKFTFINFLHEQGRLFDYLNLGLEFPLRKDYARYIVWVASHFREIVEYGRDIQSIDVIEPRTSRGTKLYEVRTSDGAVYLARSLVMGTGRTPNIPSAFRSLLGSEIFHFTEYLGRIKAMPQSPAGGPRRFCVVGGSQSAIEITLDLLKRFPGCEVVNVSRNFSYRLKDTSPFSEHVYFPEFVDLFFDAPSKSKDALWEQLKYTNYSSADANVIQELYLKMYEQRLEGGNAIRLMFNSNVERVTTNSGRVSLDIRNIHTGKVESVAVHAVVLATGFRNLGTGPNGERYPALLANLAGSLKSTADGVLEIGRDYELSGRSGGDAVPPIYLNGLCESSHGFGDAGSFSLLAIRSDRIGRSLARQLGGMEEPGQRRREIPTHLVPEFSGVRYASHAVASAANGQAAIP